METHALYKLGSILAPTVGPKVRQNDQKQLYTCGKYTDKEKIQI